MTALSRRSLITGLVAFVAAPAIVRASSLMQLRSSPALVIPKTHTIQFIVNWEENPVYKVGAEVSALDVRGDGSLILQMRRCTVSGKSSDVQIFRL